MVYRITDNDNNPLVQELLKDLAPRYDVSYAMFEGDNAEIELQKQRNHGLVKNPITVDGPSFMTGMKFENNHYTMSFNVPAEDHKINIAYPRNFHEVVGNLIRADVINVPEKAKASLSYNYMPIGSIRSFPNNILKHLTGFRIGVDGASENYISWPNKTNENEIDVGQYGFGSVTEEQLVRLHDAITRTGFVEKQTSQINGCERQNFILLEPMNAQKLKKLEDILQNENNDDNHFNFNGEYSFGGEMESESLSGLPDISDKVMGKFYMKTPNFDLRFDSGKEGSMVIPRNLEHAAMLSDVCNYKSKASILKK